MQIWTPEKLSMAANLYNLGIEPKVISAEIEVPLRQVVWLIGYRKDLFGGGQRTAPEKAMRKRKPESVREGRSLLVLVQTPRRKAEFEPGIDAFAALPAAPVGRPVNLLQMTSRHCKWPLSMDGSSSKLFCGDAAISGQSWCAHHADRVREKAADTRGAAR